MSFSKIGDQSKARKIRRFSEPKTFFFFGDHHKNRQSCWHGGKFWCTTNKMAINYAFVICLGVNEAKKIKNPWFKNFYFHLLNIQIFKTKLHNFTTVRSKNVEKDKTITWFFLSHSTTSEYQTYSHPMVMLDPKLAEKLSSIFTLWNLGISPPPYTLSTTDCISVSISQFEISSVETWHQ